MTILFKNRQMTVVKQTYLHGGICLSIIDEDGEVYAIATVNTDFPLLPDQLVIKNYSENEGILEALIEGKVVKPLHRKIPLGYTSGDLVKLTWTE